MQHGDASGSYRSRSSLAILSLANCGWTETDRGAQVVKRRGLRGWM